MTKIHSEKLEEILDNPERLEEMLEQDDVVAFSQALLGISNGEITYRSLKIFLSALDVPLYRHVLEYEKHPQISLYVAQRLSPNELGKKEMQQFFIKHLKQGNTDIVSTLLKAGLSPNFAVTVGSATLEESPLHVAISRRLKDMIDLLLEAKDLDPNFKSQHERTPLLTAVLARDEELVKRLVEKGADPNGDLSTEASAAFVAKEKGSTAIADYLVQQGALDIHKMLDDDNLGQFNTLVKDHPFALYLNYSVTMPRMNLIHLAAEAGAQKIMHQAIACQANVEGLTENERKSAQSRIEQGVALGASKATMFKSGADLPSLVEAAFKAGQDDTVVALIRQAGTLPGNSVGKAITSRGLFLPSGSKRKSLDVEDKRISVRRRLMKKVNFNYRHSLFAEILLHDRGELFEKLMQLSMEVNQSPNLASAIQVFDRGAESTLSAESFKMGCEKIATFLCESGYAELRFLERAYPALADSPNAALFKTLYEHTSEESKSRWRMSHVDNFGVNRPEERQATAQYLFNQGEKPTFVLRYTRHIQTLWREPFDARDITGVREKCRINKHVILQRNVNLQDKHYNVCAIQLVESCYASDLALLSAMISGHRLGGDKQTLEGDIRGQLEHYYGYAGNRHSRSGEYKRHEAYKETYLDNLELGFWLADVIDYKINQQQENHELLADPLSLLQTDDIIKHIKTAKQIATMAEVIDVEALSIILAHPTVQKKLLKEANKSPEKRGVLLKALPKEVMLGCRGFLRLYLSKKEAGERKNWQVGERYEAKVDEQVTTHFGDLVSDHDIDKTQMYQALQGLSVLTNASIESEFKLFKRYAWVEVGEDIVTLTTIRTKYENFYHLYNNYFIYLNEYRLEHQDDMVGILERFMLLEKEINQTLEALAVTISDIADRDQKNDLKNIEYDINDLQETVTFQLQTMTVGMLPMVTPKIPVSEPQQFSSEEDVAQVDYKSVLEQAIREQFGQEQVDVTLTSESGFLKAIFRAELSKAVQEDDVTALRNLLSLSETEDIQGFEQALMALDTEGLLRLDERVWGIRPSLLLAAAQHNSMIVYDALIEKGLTHDVNEPMLAAQTVLYLAKFGHLDRIKAILEAQCPGIEHSTAYDPFSFEDAQAHLVHLQSGVHYRFGRAMKEAMEHGHIEVAQYLFEHGANLGVLPLDALSTKNNTRWPEPRKGFTHKFEDAIGKNDASTVREQVMQNKSLVWVTDGLVKTCQQNALETAAAIVQGFSVDGHDTHEALRDHLRRSLFSLAQKKQPDGYYNYGRTIGEKRQKISETEQTQAHHTLELSFFLADVLSYKQAKSQGNNTVPNPIGRLSQPEVKDHVQTVADVVALWQHVDPALAGTLLKDKGIQKRLLKQAKKQPHVRYQLFAVLTPQNCVTHQDFLLRLIVEPIINTSSRKCKRNEDYRQAKTTEALQDFFAQASLFITDAKGIENFNAIAAAEIFPESRAIEAPDPLFDQAPVLRVSGSESSLAGGSENTASAQLDGRAGSDHESTSAPKQKGARTKT